MVNIASLDNRASGSSLTLLLSARRLSWSHVPRIAGLVVLLTGLLIFGGKSYFPEQLLIQVPMAEGISRGSALLLILMGLGMRLSRWEILGGRARRLARSVRFGCALVVILGLFPSLARKVIPLDWDMPLQMTLLGVLICGELSVTGSKGSRRASQVLSLSAFTFGLVATIPWLYDMRLSDGIPSWMAMPPMLSTVLLIGATGRVLSNFNQSLMEMATSDIGGGVTACWLLPASFALPILLGWARLLGERQGWFSPAAGLLLHIIVTIALLVALVAWSAAHQVRAHAESERLKHARLECETAYLQLLYCSDQPFVETDLRGRILHHNEAAVRLVLGSDLCDLLVAAQSAALLSGTPFSRTVHVFGPEAPASGRITAVPRFENGSPTSVLGMVQLDPTESGSFNPPRRFC